MPQVQTNLPDRATLAGRGGHGDHRGRVIFLGGGRSMYDSILVEPPIGVGFMILHEFCCRLPAMEKRGLQWIAAIGRDACRV